MTAMPINLSPAEIEELTGYQVPSKQLATLKAQGFWRARRSIRGHVILERAHYEAVCAGATQGQTSPTDGPRLRLPQLRRAA